MKTKPLFQKHELFKLFMLLPAIIFMLVVIVSCSASKKAAKVNTEIAPPPPPPPPPPPAEEEVPFVVVEEMPQFPGGDTMLLKYIIEHTNYPVAAKENNIQGRVIVRFCITSEGSISRTSVLRGVSPEIDAEAVRVVNSLPQFKPGKQGGKAVPVWYMVPISFTLNNTVSKKISSYEVVGNDTIYSFASENPKYPGGSEALMKFKSENVTYSALLKSLGVEGFVVVGFVVEKNGSLSNIKIERGSSPSLDAEALRVTKVMPAWLPGKEYGKAVKFKYSTGYNFIVTPYKATEYKEGDPYVVVEEMPVFPGGDTALLSFIARNTKYPEFAKANNIQGRVIVRFCVTETGGVDRASILKGVSPELDEEALRVVKTLPEFKPGKQGGKPVAVWYMVPITFALKSSSADGKIAPPPPPPAPPSYDEIPVFPGGEQAILKFISSNLKYPETAKAKKISGRVWLNYSINPDGSVGDVKVMQGIDPVLDAEAVRIVSLIPEWIPGKMSGIPVKVTYPISVNFQLK